LLKLADQGQEFRQHLLGPLGLQALHDQKSIQLLLGKVKRLQHRRLGQVLFLPVALAYQLIEHGAVRGRFAAKKAKLESMMHNLKYPLGLLLA